MKKNIDNIINELLSKSKLTVMDVGARDGLSPYFSKYEEKLSNIVLVEPDPDEQIKLQEKYANALIIDKGLGSKQQDVKLNLCRKEAVSSIYEPNTSFLDNYNNSERFDVVKKIDISLTTIDLIASEYNIEMDYMKLDTQGYELEILKGARNSLRKTIMLEVEIEYSEMYKGQPLFFDVVKYLDEIGFQLLDLSKVYWRSKKSKLFYNTKGRLVFGDALFIKKDLINTKVPLKDLKTFYKLFTLLLIYGYFESAEDILENNFSILEKEEYQYLSEKLSEIDEILLQEKNFYGFSSDKYNSIGNLI